MGSSFFFWFDLITSNLKKRFTLVKSFNIDLKIRGNNYNSTNYKELL